MKCSAVVLTQQFQWLYRIYYSGTSKYCKRLGKNVYLKNLCKHIYYQFNVFKFMVSYEILYFFLTLVEIMFHISSTQNIN